MQDFTISLGESIRIGKDIHIKVVKKTRRLGLVSLFRLPRMWLAVGGPTQLA